MDRKSKEFSEFSEFWFKIMVPPCGVFVFVFVFLAHATWFLDLSSPYQELNQGQSSESMEVTRELPKQLCS